MKRCDQCGATAHECNCGFLSRVERASGCKLIGHTTPGCNTPGREPIKIPYELSPDADTYCDPELDGTR